MKISAATKVFTKDKPDTTDFVKFIIGLAMGLKTEPIILRRNLLTTLSVSGVVGTRHFVIDTVLIL